MDGVPGTGAKRALLSFVIDTGSTRTVVQPSDVEKAGLDAETRFPTHEPSPCRGLAGRSAF